MKQTLSKTNYRKHDANEVRSAHNRAGFPKTDCNYQTASLTDFNGRCSGGRAKIASFRKISASYFEREARQSFVTEAGFFAIIVVTAAVPLVSSAYALVNLLHSIGSF